MMGSVASHTVPFAPANQAFFVNFSSPGSWIA